MATMVEAGELEVVGDPTADPRVYREAASGHFMIGDDLHGLWPCRWRTELQAQAVADFEAMKDQARELLGKVGAKSIDASSAGYAAATALLGQAAALLHRAADVLEETPHTEGDGPGAGEILRDLDDPEDRAPSAAERATEEDRPVEDLFAETRARIAEYEAACREKSWEAGLSEAERQRRTDAQRDATEYLFHALADQSWRVFRWTAFHPTALYNGTLYIPYGCDDDGIASVLKVPLTDIIGLDEVQGEGWKTGRPDEWSGD